MRAGPGSTRLLLPPLALLLAVLAVGLETSRSRPTRHPTPAAARPGPDSPPGQLRPPEAPGLLFDPAEIDLGRLEPGERRSSRAGWIRTGAGELVVHAVKPDCGCAAARGIPRRLAPGRRGELALDVRAPSRPGPFRFRICVVTDAARRGAPGIFTLYVSGCVRDSVVAYPADLALPACPTGKTVVRRIEVVATRAAAALPIRARLEGLDGDVVVEEPVVRGRPGWCLRLELRAPEEPAPFRGVLRVEIGDRIRLHVPVRGVAVAAPPPGGEGGTRRRATRSRRAASRPW